MYRRPGSGGYGDSRVFQPGDALSVQVFPDVPLPVTDLLG